MRAPERIRIVDQVPRVAHVLRGEAHAETLAERLAQGHVKAMVPGQVVWPVAVQES